MGFAGVQPLVAQMERWFYGYSESPPSTGIIEVEMEGGLAGRRFAFDLTRAGSIKIQERDNSRTLLKEYSWSIGEREATQLIDDAVQCGLAVFDPEGRAAEHKKQGRSAPDVMDGSVVHFALNLDYLAVGGEEATSPYRHEFRLAFPREHAQAFPSEAEYACLDKLVMYLSDIYYRARRAAN